MWLRSPSTNKIKVYDVLLISLFVDHQWIRIKPSAGV